MADLNALIAQGAQFHAPADPFAQYAKMQQLQQGQQANMLNQMKMDEYRQSVQRSNALRASPAPEGVSAAHWAIDPAKALEIAKEQATAAAQSATATHKKAQTVVEGQKWMDQAKRDLAFNPSPENIKAYAQDAVLHGFMTVEQATATADQLLKMPSDQLRQVLTASGATAGDLKPTTQVIDQSGQRSVISIPAGGGTPTTLGVYADVPLPANVQAQKERTARAGASNISVSTEKKYGEAFGSKLAETDIVKMSAAEKAPQLAESANRIIDLVKQGNLFTGPAADIKLNIARAMNVAGASNQDKIANTEALISATGKSTLDAIHGAGLGTGQGFTDKDLKFLQGIAGGTVNLTQQTLTELAALQHKVATKTAESWNKRVKEMPQEVVKGTGLSTTPITVPPLSSLAKRLAAPTTSAPQGVDSALWNVMPPEERALWQK